MSKSLPNYKAKDAIATDDKGKAAIPKQGKKKRYVYKDASLASSPYLEHMRSIAAVHLDHSEHATVEEESRYSAAPISIDSLTKGELGLAKKKDDKRFLSPIRGSSRGADAGLPGEPYNSLITTPVAARTTMDASVEALGLSSDIIKQIALSPPPKGPWTGPLDSPHVSSFQERKKSSFPDITREGVEHKHRLDFIERAVVVKSQKQFTMGEKNHLFGTMSTKKLADLLASPATSGAIQATLDRHKQVKLGRNIEQSSVKGLLNDLNPSTVSPEELLISIFDHIQGGVTHNPQKTSPFSNFQGENKLSNIPVRSRSPLGVGINESSSSHSLNDILAGNDIHRDPLYGILKEEVERINSKKRKIKKFPQDNNPALGGIAKRFKNSSKINEMVTALTLGVPISSAIPMKTIAMEAVLPAELHALSHFSILPPAVWVTARVVYFLLIAYHQTVVCDPQNVLYVAKMNIDNLWLAIDKQRASETSGGIEICAERVDELFSWSCLKALFTFPVLFTKALRIIERGVGETVEERQLFFVNFPFHLLQSLRKIISQELSLFNSCSSWSIAHTLPVVAKLCFWSKRIIAALYATSLAKLRLNGSSVVTTSVRDY